MNGPLSGMRIVEFGGIGPGPFAGMMLADLGAQVIVIDRPGNTLKGDPALEFLRRGKRSVTLDVKENEGRGHALQLIKNAHGLIEGFRPGVMERLRLGPDECLDVQPALAYGRMTGWGQTGPLAQRAGHDINYLALSGALHAIGTKAAGPVVPLNIIGDFGAGGMLLAFGLVSALWHARETGTGQVIDASILGGSSVLMAMVYSRYAMELWSDERESNLLDGGTPYYATYRCNDDKWVAVGPLEQTFFNIFLDALGIDANEYGDRDDRRLWPMQRELLAHKFRQRSRDEWAELMAPLDACVTPVLSLEEARHHPHNLARQTFLPGAPAQPAPAPLFSRTPSPPPQTPPAIGAELWPIDWV